MDENGQYLCYDILNDAHKIAQLILERVVNEGQLDANMSVRFSDLKERFGLQSEKYACVCVQYLIGIGCLERQGPMTTQTIGFVAKAGLIDFLATSPGKKALPY